MDDLLVEMIELPDVHPWFLACQAHPEFLSTPRDGHPLFVGFIRAAREHKAMKAWPAASCRRKRGREGCGRGFSPAAMTGVGRG